MEKIEESNFVNKVVKDPAKVPKVHVLRGYVGKSSLKDHTRLYLNVQLSDYYDIPTKDVLDQVIPNTKYNVLEESILWVDQNSNYTRNGVSLSDVKESFFTGDLVTAQSPGDKKCNCAKETKVGPTGWYGCGQFVGPTGVQNCTQSPEACGHTAWHGCVIGPTGIYGCTSDPAHCGNTSWQGCKIGPTGVYLCTSSPENCGHTSWKNCPPLDGPTGVMNCTQAPPVCGNTSWKGCPSGNEAAPENNIGVTGWYTCVPTAPPACVGPTGWLGCNQAPAGPTGVLYCTSTPALCGNTAWQGCPEAVGPTGVMDCTKAPELCGNTKWEKCPAPKDEGKK